MGLAEVDEREEGSLRVDLVEDEVDLRVGIDVGEAEALEPPRERILLEPVHRARAHRLVPGVT